VADLCDELPMPALTRCCGVLGRRCSLALALTDQPERLAVHDIATSRWATVTQLIMTGATPTPAMSWAN
jgi:hypothetical protein